MIQCQNCGQANTSESNFCRFCGTRTVASARVGFASNNQSPPRPYMWKTDEFQIAEAKMRQPGRINQVQPLTSYQPTPPVQRTPPPFAQYQPAPVAGYGYRCPRCGTQTLPRFSKKISPAGWIVFAALLIVFFPLFWIGLLIKEDVRICPICNGKVG